MADKRKQFFDLRYPKTDLPLHLDELGSQLTIEAVVYSGNGLSVVVPLPGESIQFTDDWLGIVEVVTEATVQDWIGILQATDDPRVFELDESGAVKAVHRKSQRTVGASVQWQVYRRDGYCCVNCRRFGGENGTALSVDHFVPVEKGGTDEMNNILTLCRRCNKMKGSQDPKDFFGADEYERLRSYLERG